MFEAAELGNTIPKDEYKARVPALRAELLKVQQQLRLLQGAPFPVIIVFAGVDGAGKGETVNILNEWMDPRWIVTRAFGDPSDEERERPEFWRFWRELPPRGRIGLFLNTWYSRPVVDRAYRRIKTAKLDARLSRIVDFEQCLADDGALILKFWMHLGRRAQKERLRTLENDPLTRWRVAKLQWKHWRMYDEFIEAAERVISRTSLPYAPWIIVEGVDERYRALTVGSRVADAIARRLTETGRPRGKPSETRAARRGPRTILASLDMSQKVAKKTFVPSLEKQQGRLNLLQRRAADAGLSAILVFEGWDAAGKGGAIRRVTAALDARACQVIPIAAPTDEERSFHYLWRFWRHLSRAGRVTIFDRSWYGRVLVERVENFASPAEWTRAYGEINEFEDQLLDHGIVLVKYWMHITKDEQLRRFRERGRISYKRWKLTDDDWRNRKKWALYESAVNQMIESTSTRRAPWTIVEGNDKNFARLKVLRTACDRIETALS